ncbi:MAG: YvcK family protein [Candidatus Spechtbacteria bacterium]|nr:YvcK family protein [Candidatus Spechtbacteria bacterium]
MQEKKTQFRIALVGGGTGTSRILTGLKDLPARVSVLVTTADSGGSSGRLRKDFNMVPPGDARQCLGALIGNETWQKYFHARFATGKLKGHNIGNLLLALLHEKNGDIQSALDEALNLFDVQDHEIVPVTIKPTSLVAFLKNGKRLRGEDSITSSDIIRADLESLSLLPINVSANPRAVSALMNADAIVVGPGNLFSSIIPNFLVPQIKEAFINSSAKKFFVANLMTQSGHTDGFTPGDYAKVVEQYTKENIFDYVLCNSRFIPRKFWNKQGMGEAVHAPLEAMPITGRAGRVEKNKLRFISGDFVDFTVVKQDPSDPLTRTSVRHNGAAIARTILQCLQ